MGEVSPLVPNTYSCLTSSTGCPGNTGHWASLTGGAITYTCTTWLLVVHHERILQVTETVWQRTTLHTRAPLGSATWAKQTASSPAHKTDMCCPEWQSTSRSVDHQTTLLSNYHSQHILWINSHSAQDSSFTGRDWRGINVGDYGSSTKAWPVTVTDVMRRHSRQATWCKMMAATSTSVKNTPKNATSWHLPHCGVGIYYCPHLTSFCPPATPISYSCLSVIACVLQKWYCFMRKGIITAPDWAKHDKTAPSS